MAQGVLPYKYEEEKKSSSMTSLAGLPLYLDLAFALGIPENIDRHLMLRPSQGWSDSRMVLSLMLLAIAGGDCVDDLRILEADEGFCRVLERIEPEEPARFRIKKARTFPSPSSVFRYLASFRTTDPPVQGAASIPRSPALGRFNLVNRDLVASVQQHDPSATATLDMDATIVETQKREALFCYEGYRAYQPLNVYWAEQELLVHTEFRDGNVSANYDLLRVFTDALDALPEGIDRVRLRADGAGYCHDLLAYCESGEHVRFGRIEFAVSCPVTEALKKETRLVPPDEWKRLDAQREWAEVGFVPNEIGHSKHGPTYRYLAVRDVLAQPVLPGMELPFQTCCLHGTQYKLRALCSNMDWAGVSLPLPTSGAGRARRPTPCSKRISSGGSFPPAPSDQMRHGGGSPSLHSICMQP